MTEQYNLPGTEQQSRAGATSQAPQVPVSNPPNPMKPIDRAHSSSKVTPEMLDNIVKHYATGMSQAEVARAYGIERRTVMKHLATPEAAALLQYYRSIVKQTFLQRTAEGLAEGVANKLQDAIESGTAKDVDAASRAMLNLEKLTQSASGEGSKVQVTGPGGDPLQIDVRAILASLKDHTQP